jgi:hypothetical protein
MERTPTTTKGHGNSNMTGQTDIIARDADLAMTMVTTRVTK